MFEASQVSESPSRRSASIPGRWEAVVLDKTPIKKGFGATSTRFSNNMNDIPGPGAYSNNETPLLAKSPSLSKKGYGNAFLSKSEKGFIPPSGDMPGPGHYDIKGMDHIELKPSQAFIKSGRGRVPYPDPALTKKNIPGPASYQVKHEYNPPLLVSKSSATFVSKSKRDSFLARHKYVICLNPVLNVSGLSDIVYYVLCIMCYVLCVSSGVPAPGKYKLDDGELSTAQTFFWSRSTYKRFQDLGMDNKVPG
jgi:hypothetical protein